MRIMMIFAILTILVVSFSGGCYAATDSVNGKDLGRYTTPSPDGSTREDLVAFIEEAVSYVQENGQDEAIRAFNDPHGKFIKRDLYIFAYDFNGTTLANPLWPDLVGKNNINLTDSNGVEIIKDLMIVAKRGKGFSYYVWPNPAHENREELKLTYVERVNDALWLGAGIYLAGPVPYFSPEDREGLIAFVEDARSFALQNGKESALEEFNNLSGRFVNASRYIFAYDFNTTTLALPMQPDLIGTSRLDIKDSNGVSFCRDFTAQAREGSGLSYLLYPDPAENMTVKLKLDYVMKVDDTWYLGSGLYAE